MLKQRSLIHPSPCNSMLRFFHQVDIKDLLEIDVP